MALITNATESWTQLTLATGEMWQVRQGRVFISRTNNPADNDGIEMIVGQGLYVPAGDLSYRKEGGNALVVREGWE
ncbi:MAG: hypothetical protein AAFR23_09975 [Pseudomonadota bacterium]